MKSEALNQENSKKIIFKKKPELLMPAGSLSHLKTAAVYGADAVYIGGDALSLRGGARNFSVSEMKKGVDFAHSRGVRVYVAVNVFAHNDDIENARVYLKELSEVNADAVIVSDPGIFTLVKEILPEMPVHISTQANCTNYETFTFWKRQGAGRVIAARELSLKEIGEISERLGTEPEIECFVHGAMCVSYSGRCLLSAYLTGRSANSGVCTHPCRWKYALEEETRPGEYFPVFEGEGGTYILNSKDLCMLPFIPELVRAGISSFKVEGRMKSVLYVAGVCRAYRAAIDDYFEDPENYGRNINKYLEEAAKCTHRKFTTGFFFGNPGSEGQIYDNATYEKEWVFLGQAGKKKNGRYVLLEQKNKFCIGDEVEVIKPGGECFRCRVLDMLTPAGEKITACPHAGELFYADFGTELSEFDIIRGRV